MSAVLEAREPSARYLAAAQPALVRLFDLLTTAPRGVTRLRELIVLLALQGKLVAQDPRDASARDWLATIQAVHRTTDRTQRQAEGFSEPLPDPGPQGLDVPPG